MGVSENAQDEKSKAISEWLKQEQAKEDRINIGGTLFGIALLIGSVFTDGLLSVFLGVSGAGVDLSIVAYNLDIAGDLNAAAKASTVGKPLVEDPEEARLNYFLSWVNVFLAGLGLGGALRTGTSVIRGAQAAKRLVTMEGAEVLRRLNREQIAQFDQAIQLRRAGQADKAESILNQLRNEINDDDVFNQASSLFERASTNTGQTLNELNQLSEISRQNISL